jgi:hypothetical protein
MPCEPLLVNCVSPKKSFFFGNPSRSEFPLARREEIELNSARRWTGTQRQTRPIGTGHREEVPMNGFIAWSGVAHPPRSRLLHVYQFDQRIPNRDPIVVWFLMDQSGYGRDLAG